MARVLIVTASMGAGHIIVARELARRFAAGGDEAEIVDVLAVAGAPGDRLRTTYRLMLGYAPWLYEASVQFWSRWSSPLEQVTARLTHSAELALDATVRRSSPDVIVSIYNLASQALGRLKARGRLHVPVATLVTDAGAHPYWVSRGVDVHIAPLASTARALERMGSRTTVTAAPVLRPNVAERPGCADARRRLRLPDRPTVLVSAASWAPSRVRRTVRLLRLSGLHVVALCGNDQRLRNTLTHQPGVRAVAWTSQMPAYLAAADVVVDNAGGLTCWEALVARTPVVLFDPLPGHGRLNAAALAEARLVEFAHSPQELLDAVHGAGPLPVLPAEWAGPPAEDVVLGLVRRLAHA
jgi:UDP-N-acetylglucosamine:LPS N-acetylglucosamine transferase